MRMPLVARTAQVELSVGNSLRELRRSFNDIQVGLSTLARRESKAEAVTCFDDEFSFRHRNHPCDASSRARDCEVHSLATNTNRGIVELEFARVIVERGGIHYDHCTRRPGCTSQCRDIRARDAIRDQTRRVSDTRKVHQDNDGDAVVDVAYDVGAESLPQSTVFDDALAAVATESPAKAVLAKGPVVQPDGTPHGGSTRGVQDRIAV